MAVHTGNWLSDTVGMRTEQGLDMKIDRRLNIKHCVCLSERACKYAILLNESRTTLNYHKYQMDWRKCAGELPDGCSAWTWSTWTERCECVYWCSANYRNGHDENSMRQRHLTTTFKWVQTDFEKLWTICGQSKSLGGSVIKGNVWDWRYTTNWNMGWLKPAMQLIVMSKMEAKLGCTLWNNRKLPIRVNIQNHCKLPLC